MADSLVLYAESLWISPYVFSSFVALTEKRLPFASRDLLLIEGEHKSGAYPNQSITRKVPALRHGEFWLAESSAIAEYLEDVFAFPAYPALFPREAAARARARQLMAWMRSDLGALREERPTSTMFYDRASEPLSRAGEAAAAELIRVTSLLISEGSGPLFGEWSLVDSELAFMLHRLLLNGHEVPERIRTFAEREWQRESVQQFASHPRPVALPAAYWGYSGLKPPVKARSGPD